MSDTNTEYEDNTDLHNNDAVTEEIAGAMAFDPFGPEADIDDTSDAGSDDANQSDTPSDGAEGESAEGSGDSTGQPAKAQETGQQPEGGHQANPELQKYIEQNQELLKQVVSGKSEGESKQTGEEDASQEDIWSQVPSYDYNVPDQLVEMMGSEDPAERKQAMSYLVKGVAQGIHQQIMSTVGSQFQNLQQNIPQTVQQMQQTQAIQQQVATDFYGKYPELNDPNVIPIVQNVAKQVLATHGGDQWSPEVRDQIGNQVKQILGKFAGNQSAGTPPRKPANPPATFQNGGASSRSSVTGAKPTTQQEHIMDIFS